MLFIYIIEKMNHTHCNGFGIKVYLLILLHL